MTAGGDGAVGALAARLRAAGSVFAEDEARVLIDSADDPDELERMTAERLQGRPLEQVVGWAEFAGLRVRVEPGVFVPRRRTELMARLAAAYVADARARDSTRTPVLVDLCCGTGAVAAAVLADVVHTTGSGTGSAPLEVHAADVDPAAVGCARRNLPATAHVHEGDLDEPLPASLHGRVDVLAANTPYVPSAQVALMPAEARLHEPLVALDGGADGLEVARRVVRAAPGWLAPHGRVLVETSRVQAPVLADAVRAAGLLAEVVHDEDLEATVVVGTRPPRDGNG